ncbi:MAG: 4-carboxymuconolactone decarboxylase [Chloroflexi bacterium]|nr:4-carboxymuconolactone decarboxylase [Chloroflexota bacterium]MBR49523.1 4-carboxymuconolactone decarboxylase [Chloroflexota bacterium]|tara:strand:- start:178 stop:555 length:378 start_codon:yes stop_codon:yes gene_type:complete
MSEQFDRGFEMRKKVLGDDYVNQSFANASEFDKPFQEFVTESAWGEVWTRDELDNKTKSIITMSVLLALRAENEIALHTRGAINNGVSAEELRAIAIHASVYAGVPSAISGMKIIKKVLQEMGKI